jgi:hypothetical protein
MYISLISVSAAAVLVVVFISLLRRASFFSSFSELVLVLAPCGLLALFFSISPLVLSPLLSVVVSYRPPSLYY